MGGTDDPHLYFSADNNSCSNDAGGRDHVYPVVTVGGLQVQRKIFVSLSGLPGARILNLITNPGGSPVTTTVQVGDLTSPSDEGDLGSDTNTAVRASSDGDTVASPADYWAVTSDDATAPGDPTLAHVVDGSGGAVKADLFQVGGGADGVPQDNVAWGWTVTIPAGGTVGLMSYEIEQATEPRSTSVETAAAADVANLYESASPSTLYQGMSPADEASVVNWPVPATTPTPTAPTGQRAAAKKHCKKKSKHNKKKLKKCLRRAQQLPV